MEGRQSQPSSAGGSPARSPPLPPPSSAAAAVSHLDGLDGDIASGDGWTPTVDMYDEPTERYVPGISFGGCGRGGGGGQSSPSPSPSGDCGVPGVGESEGADVNAGSGIGADDCGDADNDNRDDDDDAFGMMMPPDTFGSASGLLTQQMSRDEESDGGGGMSGTDDEEDGGGVGSDGDSDDGGDGNDVDDDDGGGGDDDDHMVVDGDVAERDSESGSNLAEGAEDEAGDGADGACGEPRGTAAEEESPASPEGGAAICGGKSEEEDQEEEEGESAAGVTAAAADAGGADFAAAAAGIAAVGGNGDGDGDADERGGDGSPAPPSPAVYAGLTEETETQLVDVLSPASRSGGSGGGGGGGGALALGPAKVAADDTINDVAGGGAVCSVNPPGGLWDADGRPDFGGLTEETEGPPPPPASVPAPGVDAEVGKGVGKEETEDDSREECGDLAEDCGLSKPNSTAAAAGAEAEAGALPAVSSQQVAPPGTITGESGASSGVRSIWMAPPHLSDGDGDGEMSKSMESHCSEGKPEPSSSAVGERLKSGRRCGNGSPSDDKNAEEDADADADADTCARDSPGIADGLDGHCSAHGEPSQQKVEGSMSVCDVMGGTLGSCSDWAIYSGETEPILPAPQFCPLAKVHDGEEGDARRKGSYSPGGDDDRVGAGGCQDEINPKEKAPPSKTSLTPEMADKEGEGKGHSSDGTDPEIPEKSAEATTEDSAVDRSQREGNFDFAHYHDVETEQFHLRQGEAPMNGKDKGLRAEGNEEIQAIPPLSKGASLKASKTKSNGAELHSPKAEIDVPKQSQEKANASHDIADDSCRHREHPDGDAQSIQEVATELAPPSSEYDARSERGHQNPVDSRDVDDATATGPLISHTQTLVASSAALSYPNDHSEISQVAANKTSFEGPNHENASIEVKGRETTEKEKENERLSANAPSPRESSTSDGVSKGGLVSLSKTTALPGKEEDAICGGAQVLSTTTVLTTTPHSQVLLDPSQSVRDDTSSLLKKLEASVEIVNKARFCAAAEDDIEETDDESIGIQEDAVVPPTHTKKSDEGLISSASKANVNQDKSPLPSSGCGRSQEEILESTPHITNKTSVRDQIQNDEGIIEERTVSRQQEASEPKHASKEAPRDSDSKSDITSKQNSSKAAVPWLHTRRGHKKGHKDCYKIQKEDIDAEDSETPQLRLPECPDPKRERKESEVDDSSSDEDISWGRNIPSSSNDDHEHLQDTQDDDGHAISLRLDSATKIRRQRNGVASNQKSFKRIQQRKGSSAQAPSAYASLAREDSRHASNETPKKPVGGKKMALQMQGDDASDQGDDDYVSDQGDDEVSSSGTDTEGTHAEGPSQPSQNTVEIESLLNRLNSAAKKLKDPAKEIEKLKRQVARLEKRNDRLRQEREKVLAENALLKKQLADKVGQNLKMKGALAELVPVIDQLPIDGTDDRQAVAKSSASKVNRKEASATENPAVVPPSSVRPTKKLARTKTARCKERSSQKKKRSDDDKTVLSALSPKGKRLDFETKKGNTGEQQASRKRSSARSIVNDGGNHARRNVTLQARSSRRGQTKRALIPKDMLNIPFDDVWNYLKEEHGWKYELGPEPYNNVYVRPSVEHLDANRINVDFFDDDTLLYAKAKELGFRPGYEESNTSDDEEEPEAEEAEDDAREADDDSQESMARVSLSASSNASDPESDDDDDDESVANDNTNLCGDAKLLTCQSMRKCARLIRTFSKLPDTASFNNLLWTPLWEQIKEVQGGAEGTNLKWQYARSRGQLAQRTYWFVPPSSKGLEGKPGIDYFVSEEAVVLCVLQQIKGFDPGALGKDSSPIKHFETILLRSVENSVAYNEARSNPDLGAGKRLRRRNVDPDIYVSPQLKKAKTKSTGEETGTKSKTKVNFEAAPALSQNTLEGAKVLMQINNAKPDGGSNGPVDCPRTPTYDDVATKKGIGKMKKSRQLALQKLSPKKRAAQSQALSAKKKQKVSTPVPKSSLSSVERLSQVPHHLSQSPDDLSQSTVVNFTREKSPRETSDRGGICPLDGLAFFVSGLEASYHRLIEELGGKVVTDVSSLNECDVHGKLWFISNASQRRKIKYIIATAFGVPMLHYTWLTDLKRRCIELKQSNDLDRIKQLPYDSALFKAKRLPIGLSLKTGLFHLQKARHAKRWYRPGQEIGSERVIFYGMKMAVALKDERVEKEWGKILSAAGASVITSSSFKSNKKCVIDAVLVDRNNLPPHTTAAPPNVTKLMNFVNSGRAKNSDGTTKVPVVDLSWALQCIVERERLCFDADERYRITIGDGTSKKTGGTGGSGTKVFEMKVKAGNDLVRYEVGDIVEFGKSKGTARIGRIKAIHDSGQSRRKAHMLDVQLLERNGNFELLDGGEDSPHVTIDENELRRHIVMLSTKDFNDIRDGGYVPKSEEESYIFVQKAPVRSKSSR